VLQLEAVIGIVERFGAEGEAHWLDAGSTIEGRSASHHAESGPNVVWVGG
jgi:hypothetical protein